MVMPSKARLVREIVSVLFILILGKVFKNRPSRTCGRQLLKNFTWSILEYFVLFMLFLSLRPKAEIFLNSILRTSV